jgi:peptidoglycan hydrolase-like protein with peptidoglycan-binding domain
VLEAAGLKVAEWPGWAHRACRPGARGEMGEIRGVMVHHTATKREGNMPSLNTLLNGRKDKNGELIPGPLSQLGLARDGTFYVLAAGRANHAGDGQGAWAGVSGNSHYIGIEAENPLPVNASWPSVQLDAYQRGVAAILRHVGLGVEGCVAHKEYAHRRKPTDPAFDMDEFRRVVAGIMRGTHAVRPLIPAATDAGRRTLRRGDQGEDVKLVQAKVRVTDDGRFGPNTEAAVRTFQRGNGLVGDGIVGPETWAKIV